MKKRIISALVTIAFTVLLVPTTVADAYTPNGNLETVDGIEWMYAVSDEKGAVVVTPTNLPEGDLNLVVPSTLGGFPVTTMARDAFTGNKNLVSIIMPDNLWYVDRNAFKDCTSLASVTFSEDSCLREIQSRAFENCQALVDLNLPSSLETIGDSSFRGTNSMKNLSIPNTVTSIGLDAFDRTGSDSIATVSMEKDSYASDYHWDETFNIKYTDNDISGDPLKSGSLLVSTEVGYVGVPVTISSYISGGSGNTQLQLQVISEDSSIYKIYDFWDTYNTKYDWVPRAAGEYTIVSTVRDTNGARVSKSIKYVVKDEASDAISIETPTVDLVSPQLLKSVIKINAKASGGSGKFSYKFNISSTLASEWSTMQLPEYNWTAYTPGTYRITVTAIEWDFIDGVKTNLDYITSDPIEFTIVRPISLGDLTSNLIAPQKSGTSIWLTATPSNGYGILKTKFEVTKDSKTNIIKGYSTDTFTSWKPSEEGDYVITATSVDEMGSTVVKTLEYSIQGKLDTLPPLKIDVVSGNLPSPQLEGTIIKLNAFYTGGIGKVLFKYEVYLDESLMFTQDFSDNASFTWTPIKEGSYKIKVTAIDEDNNDASFIVFYVITKKEIIVPETKRFDTPNSRIDIGISEVETLAKNGLPFYVTFTRNGYIDLSINFKTSKDVLSEMNKFILRDLSFSFKPNSISDISLISTIEPTRVVNKFNINSNLSIVPAETTFVINVGSSHDGKLLYLYHVDSSNKFTFVKEQKISVGRLAYTTQALGDYIILDTKVEDSLLEDIPPVVTPPVVDPPKTGDSRNLYLVALMLIVSSVLIIGTSSKRVKVKVKN